ncbi:hypothetical protein EST38_g8477 [Candolleomyces aberdarensis]|uniref:Uncharacterized protein n=1 Tax=Candolleomyces aberdarensis TaxID=2316362 RepID=A0A4Q2DCI6_9AGAR|nr:hypothetical protein EST38_g8477 [Candolleomyces aberdarensis]
MPPLPTTPYTPEEFVAHMQRLFTAGQTAEFLKFALTGQYQGRQATIDCLQNRLYDRGGGQEAHPYSVTRDYDSVLGMSPDICIFNQSITISILPRFQDSLSKNVGITRTIEYQETDYEVDLHRIPNLPFAKWMVRNELRIFFPGLWIPKQREHHSVRDNEIRLFYEHCMRPALVDAMPRCRADDLPPTYSAELFRARAPNGQLVFSGRMVGADAVGELGNRFREHIESACAQGLSLEWARGFFFLHQIRGTKNVEPHDLRDASSRLNDFLHQNGLSRTVLRANPHDWYLDIGLEVSSDLNSSLAWRTDSHPHLLHDIFTIPMGHAIRMTTMGSSSYTRDFTSHLTQVAGCRVQPGVQGRGPYGIRKMQAYQTDKALTANPGEGRGYHAKHITLSQLIDSNHPRFLDKLYELYEEASRKNSASHARIEARVPYSFHRRIFPEELNIEWERYLVAIPTDVWWWLRAYPVLAYKYIADFQFNGPPADRVSIPSILLLAGAAWLTNCLHATPDVGPSSRNLLKAILPHLPKENISEHMKPFPIARTDPLHRQLFGNDPDGGDNDEDPVPDAEFRGALRMRSPPVPFPHNPPELENNDDQGRETAPCYPYGYFFLRTVRFDAEHPTPGMERSPHSRIPEKTFEHFYGAPYTALLDFAYNGSLAVKSHPSRSSNKINQPVYHPPPEQPIPILFTLSIGDQLVPENDWDYNPLADDMDEDRPRERVTWNYRLSQIWTQCMLDAMATVPNPQGATEPCYCILSKSARQEITEKIFADMNIGRYFNKARWKVGSPKDHKYAFDNLFLEKGRLKAGQIQNFNSCSYYKMWNHFRENNTKEVTEEARKLLRKRFDKKIFWFPWVKNDRIWLTTKDKDGKFKKTPGLGDGEPSPVFLTKANLRWNPEPRQDESEDDVSSVASAGMEVD